MAKKLMALVLAMVMLMSLCTVAMAGGSITVTYDANGADSGTVPVDSNTYSKNASAEITVLGNTGNLVKNGYSFVGWTFNGTTYVAGNVYTAANGVSSVTFTAKWEQNTPTPPAVDTYIVTFDANGGTGTMASATNVSGTYTLPACGFTAPEDMVFDCWATCTDVASKVGAAGETMVVTEDVTLYAIWKDAPIVVTATTTTLELCPGVKQDITVNFPAVDKSVKKHDAPVASGSDLATWTDIGAEVLEFPITIDTTNAKIGDKVEITIVGRNNGDKLKSTLKITVTVVAHHVVEHADEVLANCVEKGNVEYWYCDKCGKYFADEDCTKVLKATETDIDPNNHKSGEWTNQKAATLFNWGYTGDFYCDACEYSETGTRIAPILVNIGTSIAQNILSAARAAISSAAAAATTAVAAATAAAASALIQAATELAPVVSEGINLAATGLVLGVVQFLMYGFGE